MTSKRASEILHENRYGGEVEVIPESVVGGRESFYIQFKEAYGLTWYQIRQGVVGKGKIKRKWFRISDGELINWLCRLDEVS